MTLKLEGRRRGATGIVTPGTVLAAAVVCGVIAALLAGPAAAQEARAPKISDQLARGKYLVTIMDCGGCHTPGAMAGDPDKTRPLGGSDIGFGIPGLGVYFPSNLSPDKATGIGAWSEREIITAVRTGTRPDGRKLAPIMPYESFSALTDADAAAVAAYLKTLKPVAHKVPGPFGENEKPTAPFLMPVLP